MSEGAWAIVATVAIFGAAQMGALIFFLGGMREKVKAIDQEVINHGDRLDEHDSTLLRVTGDVSELKGRMRFR